jgi:hypothetical protein
MQGEVELLRRQNDEKSGIERLVRFAESNDDLMAVAAAVAQA